MISQNSIFIYQLFGIIFACGFVGEYYRSLNSASNITPQVFIINILAGCTVAFLIVYELYNRTGNRSLTISLGGLISYHEQQYITSLSKSFLNRVLGTREEENHE